MDGDLVAREGELMVDPLQVILVEEGGNGLEGGDSSPTKKVGVELVKEEREGGESWKYSCLVPLCQCLGMPTEGFEGEILKLLKRMNEKREQFENLIGKKRK